MKRTQLYLDDDMARILATVSRQRGATISQLVRESVRATFGRAGALDKPAMARRLAGIWKDRTDVGTRTDSSEGSGKEPAAGD